MGRTKWHQPILLFIVLLALIHTSSSPNANNTLTNTGQIQNSEEKIIQEIEKTMVHLGLSTRFDSTFPHGTGNYQAIRDAMNLYNLNTIRFGSNDFFNTDGSKWAYPWNNGSAEDWFLANTNYTVICDRHHTTNIGSLTATQIADIKTNLDTMATRWAGYGDRIIFEPINEYHGLDFYTLMQDFLTNFRNQGHTQPLIFNRMGLSESTWTNYWPEGEGDGWRTLTDSLNKTYQGFHFYMNYATQTNDLGTLAYNALNNGYAITGQPMLCTEIGADYREPVSSSGMPTGYFSQHKINAVNTYLDKSYDAGFGNLLWMCVGIRNLPHYYNDYSYSGNPAWNPPLQWPNAISSNLNFNANMKLIRENRSEFSGAMKLIRENVAEFSANMRLRPSTPLCAWGDPNEDQWEVFYRAGDVNRNGAINSTDSDLVNAHYGERGSPGWISEDLDSNGIIDVRDLAIVNKNLGKSICDLAVGVNPFSANMTLQAPANLASFSGAMKLIRSNVAEFSAAMTLQAAVTPTFSPVFNQILRRLERTQTPNMITVGGQPEVRVGGPEIRVGVLTKHFEKVRKAIERKKV